MLVHAFAASLIALSATVTPVAHSIASADAPSGHVSVEDQAAAPDRVVSTPGTVPTDDTVNDFLPADRDVSDCISAVPRPGCGSEARGGWHQGLVLLAVVAGLGAIAAGVVLSSRRARQRS